MKKVFTAPTIAAAREAAKEMKLGLNKKRLEAWDDVYYRLFGELDHAQLDETSHHIVWHTLSFTRELIYKPDALSMSIDMLEVV